MDKVDALLEEIYFEMEMEELEELFEGLLAEEQPPVSPEKVKAAQDALKALHDKIAAAKAANQPQIVKDLMAKATEAKQKLNLLKFKWSRFKAGSGISDLKTKAGEVAGQAAERTKELAGTAKKGAGELIKKAGSTDTGKAVSGAVHHAAQAIQQNPGTAAAVAAGAIAAVAAGVAVYKKFFSQAAKACKDKSGPDKKACVKSFKAKGLQAAKAKVSAGMSKCKGNPKCEAKIKAKMQSFDAKIGALKESLSEDIINSYVGAYLSEEFEFDSKN
jgi:hypothetical protein